MKFAWVVVALAAGCGQIASQDLVEQTRDGELAIDGSHGLVKLVVTSVESRKEPIAGATVLIDRGGGGDALERTVTDDAGVAQFAAAGIVACHVVYQTDDGTWHVYTVGACRAGTIELGGSDAVLATRKAMTFSLPASSGATSFRIAGPSACGDWEAAASPTFTAPYRRACEGETVHLFACASGATGEQCFDAGDVTLTDGATRIVTGAYRAPDLDQVRITHLPVDLRTLEVSLLARSADEVTQLPMAFANVTAPGTATTVSLSVIPGGDLLWVSAARDPGGQRSLITRTELVAPATLGPTSRFNAKDLLTPFTSLSSAGLALRWSGGGDGDGGTITVLQASSDFSGPAVQWSAYLDPSASSVSFPVLPDDLSDAVPSRWRFAAVIKLDVPGETADGLIRAIDRTWFQWPNNAKLMPVGGGRSVRATQEL